MKKLFCALLAALLLCSLAACGTKDNNGADGAADTPPASQSQGTGGIDVDLTVFSSTMVYSEVYSMMSFPDDYIGKTVKMKGQFAIGYVYNTDGTPDESTARFACVIADATACCSQGLEFILTGEHTYPDEYPELGAEITVVGTFEWYEEDGCRYYRLGNASFVN